MAASVDLRFAPLHRLDSFLPDPGVDPLDGHMLIPPVAERTSLQAICGGATGPDPIKRGQSAARHPGGAAKPPQSQARAVSGPTAGLRGAA